MTDPLERALSQARRQWIPDGVTTSGNALAALRTSAIEFGLSIDVALLPGQSLGDSRHYLDLMRLVLFDIDGTLLWTDGAGRRAIHRALIAEAGMAGPIETYRFDGKTDPQIVRELLTLGGHPDAEAPDQITAVCRHYIEVLQEELRQAPEGTRLLPGVATLLTALEAHEGAGRVLVGLLTGNVKPGAELKLRAAGMEPGRFAVGAYGSDSGRRAELPAIAAERAGLLVGRPFVGADIVIIGDTPDDVACGRPIGARSVAVATGFYDTAALRAAGATHVFESLADTTAVLDALLS